MQRNTEIWDIMVKKIPELKGLNKKRQLTYEDGQRRKRGLTNFLKKKRDEEGIMIAYLGKQRQKPKGLRGSLL